MATLPFTPPPPRTLQLEEGGVLFSRTASRALHASSPSFSRTLSQPIMPRKDGSALQLTTLTARLGMEVFNFHQTSDESFEARLMAGGYTGYGSAYGSASQNFPEKSSESTLFVNQPSPPQSTPLPLQSPPPAAAPEDAKARRKERRLAAFRRGACPQTGLRPVEVEGRGRILLDFHDNEEETRKRPVRRRRTRTNAVEEGRTMTKGLDWPDEQFPWNLRMREAKEREVKEEEARLRLIEKFLDQVSDEEDETDGDDPEREFYYVARRCFDEEEDDYGLKRVTQKEEGLAYEDLDVEPMSLDPRNASGTKRFAAARRSVVSYAEPSSVVAKVTNGWVLRNRNLRPSKHCPTRFALIGH
ncbi:hypothetical protein K488DRAFT_89802 [Vararia minispora EC-137]|uniref:Uncharacterized protein n=1 Tax=Vararia minispora EC-137 TaxID=1314806 RepID=A0ACB8Q9H6_9AGAM|nr:hypothetical protein K488DRAFT_89802 [Vararia minispora EC-137]